MTLTLAERDRRWRAAIEIMERHDIDVVVACSNLGDVPADQRYLSGYRSQYDDAAVLLFRDGASELVVTHPALPPLAKALSWIEEPVAFGIPRSWAAGKGIEGEPIAAVPSVGGQIANLIGRRCLTRIGVVGLDAFPSGWKATVQQAIPAASFVDLLAEFARLRIRKSEEELQIIREACRIADAAWSRMAEFARVGRKRYEVLADIEHVLRLNGCEDSYNLFLRLPMLQEPLDRNPYSALPVRSGDVYVVEVSPRYLGYFAQQTGLVSFGPIPDDMRKAYEAVVRARDAGLAVMKAGVDILRVTEAVGIQLRSDGFQPASPFIGHFVGLELEEPRAGNASLILEEGMVFIFHPFAAGFPAVMRADTYLVTRSGVERLTSGSLAPLEL